MRAIPNTPGVLRSADGSYSGFHRRIFIHIVPTGRHDLSSFDILTLTPSSDLGWNELPRKRSSGGSHSVRVLPEALSASHPISFSVSVRVRSYAHIGVVI